MTDQIAPDTQSDDTAPEASLSSVLEDLVDSVEMGEDGELEILLASKESDDQASDGEPDTPATQTKKEDTSDGEDDDDEPAPTDTWEGRYRDLQSHKDKQLGEAYEQMQFLREEVARLEGAQEASQKNQDQSSTEDDDDDDLLLLGDENAIAKAVERGVQAELEKRGLSDLNVTAVQDAMEDRELAIELTDCREKYEDFDDLVPQIQTVLQRFSDSDMGFDQAYQIVKLWPTTPEPAKQEPVTPDAAVDAAEKQRRIEKAQRLNLPASQNPDNPINQKPEDADSIKDAIHGAFDEALGG